MDIRNTRQLKDFSAGRLANARDGQKIILYFSLITIAATALANVASYVLSRQIAKTGGLGSMGVRSALTTAQTLLPLVQAGFLMCLTLGYLATMLRIARGQYASPNGMRLGFDRFWVLLRCTLLKGLIFGGAAAASLYVAMMIYMMTPFSNAAVDILMPLVKNAGASGIALDEAPQHRRDLRAGGAAGGLQLIAGPLHQPLADGPVERRDSVGADGGLILKAGEVFAQCHGIHAAIGREAE